MAIITSRDKLHSLAQRVKRAKEEQKKAVQAAMNTASAAGAAFGVSYLEAAYPDSFGQGVFGVDASLLVGLVGVGLGATGMAGDAQTSAIVESMGMGALAAYAAKKGREKGAEKAEEK